MDLTSITKAYFNFFSNKDISNLSKLYSEDVRLKDWEIDVEGKDKVMKVNADVFNDFKSVKIKPLNILHRDNYTFSQIQIFLNEDIFLEVVDIISFNKNGEINFIRAYKG